MPGRNIGRDPGQGEVIEEEKGFLLVLDNKA